MDEPEAPRAPLGALVALCHEDEPRLRHLHRVPARAGRAVDLPEWVDPGLAMALSGTGVHRIWAHQAEAAEAAYRGRHVVVATGTASGKSLAYLLPGLTAVAEGARAPGGRAATVLYLAPTKALAADQATRIGGLMVPGVRAATYDGDTPPEERRWIRAHANVVLTNPDLIHHSLLPRHQAWGPFLRALRFVVVDECHAYRGIFGSTVALVLRRLRRVLERYRARPTFVLASATVADPAEHASELIGMPVHAVVEDASPRGALDVAFWEPPIVEATDGSVRRRSANAEAADLLAGLVGSGVQTLAFARSRVGVESVASAAARTLAEVGVSTARAGPLAELGTPTPSGGPAQASLVAAYRGGYLPEERRALEADLRTGRLRGLAATNALELGIDIHGLDAVVMAGWPGRLASLWQQAGRAGRRGADALAVLVAADDPLDAYVLAHPDLVFGAPIERTIVNPRNPRLMATHLPAAAYERPLTEADAAVFGDGISGVLDDLVAEGVLRRRPTGWYWPVDSPPEPGSLRGAGPVVAVVEEHSGRVIGTVDRPGALVHVHPGAVHVHQGTAYVVLDLDLEGGVARVVRGDPGWTTRAQSHSQFELGQPLRTDRSGPVTVALGEVTVRTRVTSFQRRLPSGEVLGVHALDLPEQVLVTEGMWWTVDPDHLRTAGVPADALPGAAHAAEHAAIGMLPLFATCDRWDIGGVSSAENPQTGLPTIVIYDGFPGGAGYAAHGHSILREWLAATHAALVGCPCESGCPRCVVSPKCGNGNNPLDKTGAATLLAVTLAALDVEGPDPHADLPGPAVGPIGGSPSATVELAAVRLES